MLTIWGRTSSSNVMKVLWTCEELGVAYKRVDAGGAFGVTKEPAYVAKNPMSLVPTIEEEDGWTLWESNSICRYLANTHDAAGTLYPKAPRPRAEVERWMDWALGHLTGPMVTIFFTHVRLKEHERDWAAEAKARAEAGRLWSIVDRAAGGKRFLCGEAPTLADVALGPWVHRWFALPIERPELPNLARLYEGMTSRPGYAQHVAVALS
ncbi:MAG TPA: glutathione S-transferase family protein [Acetobacteraceae bacterium]|nr:glutathione S-transferase family protein [Acetobacteraceae bacterium]